MFRSVLYNLARPAFCGAALIVVGLSGPAATAEPGLDIELKPLLERGHLLGLAVVRENPRMNDRVIRAGEEMVGELPGLRRHAADDGGGADFIPRGHALDLAHVAVLTRHAAGGGGAGAVFAERFFQAEAVE